MAQFHVASVFSSNMVLQREKPVCIFGSGEDGDCISVFFMNRQFSANVAGERWRITLPPMEAGENYEMLVRSARTGAETRFYNIAVGEVWLAGGQSNMELELQTMYRGGETLADTSYDAGRVRFYYTQKNAYMDELFFEQEANSGWSEFSSEGARAWSAVGYLFAKRIAKELGCIVGVIGCNWGGTSASAWMSEAALADDADTKSYLDEYERAIEGKTEAEQLREYAEYEIYQNAWYERQMKLYETKPDATWAEVLELCGECKWPGPMNIKNPFRPSGLYHCMLERVMPYTLRGFLYYQGESDDHKPRMYYKLFTRMIHEWRKDWGDLNLPFLMVQLPMHRYEADPDYKHWCLIREAQMQAFQTVKNTGIAVIIDSGEFNEIHPKNKFPVGERLALQALYHVYHMLPEAEAFGPIYRNCYPNAEGGLTLCFDHAEAGFDVRHDLQAQKNAGISESEADHSLGFALAGADKVFYPAERVKLLNGEITLSADKVAAPVYARYCWTNYGEAPIFGKNGIPLAPFRTDIHDEASGSDKAQEVKTEIQQNMEL